MKSIKEQIRSATKVSDIESLVHQAKGFKQIALKTLRQIERVAKIRLDKIAKV